MKNKVATALKATSIICFLLGILGGYLMGKEYKVFDHYSYVLNRDIYAFNKKLMIEVWVGCFISCLIIYAVGEIINQLSKSNGSPMIKNGDVTNDISCVDISKKLEGLRDAHNKGLITDEEYTKKRSDIINQYN